MISKLIDSIDWANLIAGAIISSIAALVVWYIKGLLEFYVSSKDLPYKIWGIWYSAEYDVKSNLPKEEKNYYLRVKIKKQLFKEVKIKALEPIERRKNQIETKWEVQAKIIQSDTLVGTWKSVVTDTCRYGTVILKFLDKGRAVGYYTGTQEFPTYGYWIMARNFEDVKRISTDILKQNKFAVTDISEFVVKYNDLN